MSMSHVLKLGAERRNGDVMVLFLVIAAGIRAMMVKVNHGNGGGVR